MRVEKRVTMSRFVFFDMDITVYTAPYEITPRATIGPHGPFLRKKGTWREAKFMT
jgi:hypothetical protein